MKRMGKNARTWGWHRWAAAALLVLALAAALAAFVTTARGDAGNPILGTITADFQQNPNGTVTAYVRGQWNWLSHTTDCNFDRAGAGVGIIWNDLNGSGTTAGNNEKERVALAGTVTGGSFKLKF